MKTKVKTRADFTVDTEPPASLRDIIIEEIAYTEHNGKSNNPLLVQSMDELMQQVCVHIEEQALQIYKSNEIWALKAWAYSNILKNTIASESTDSMVQELISPIVEFQQQSFDPLAHFRKRLERKSPRTKEAYLQCASKFVLKEGKKILYADEDIEDYQTYAMRRYKNDHTYYQEMRRLLQFLRSLPDGFRNRELPLGMPKSPKKSKLYRPIASLDDIETLIWVCVFENVSVDMVIRLIGATVYGRRRSELAEFEVHLNGANSSILFPTRKGGEESPHPIPQSLVPLFAVPIESWHPHTVDRRFKKLCKQASVNLPPRAGVHWIRRRVATTVRKVCNSDIDAYRFMRWCEPRELGMLAYYDQTPYQETDNSILSKHPIVKMWEEVLPYMLDYNSSYQGMLNNT